MTKPWKIKRFGPKVTKAELHLFHALNRAKMPFTSQVPIRTENGCFTVDFLVDGLLPVEVKGDSHRGDTQLRKDEWKDSELKNAGFPPLWVTDEEVFSNVEEVVNRIREGLKRMRGEKNG